MKSRMNSSILHYIFFIFILVFSSASCKTPASPDRVSQADQTISQDENVSDNKTVGSPDLREFDGAEFPGVYKLTGDPICNITLSIKNDSEGYSYAFSGGFASSGRIGLEKKDGSVFVYFNGTKCGGNKESASGIYTYKTIKIQKNGNSTGHNSCFRECDSRILMFIKK